MSKKLVVWAPEVPGSDPSAVGACWTLKKAREIAARFAGRRDLTHQDVVIRRGEKFVEYAGPAR